MEPRPRLTIRILNKIVETIVEFVIPNCRQADLWDLWQVHPPAYAYELANCTVRAIVDETERALYPAIAIHRGSPAPEEKRKRLNDMPPMLCQAVEMWMFGCIAYMAGNARMIPDVAHLQFFAIAFPSVVLGLAIRFQREGLAPGVIVAPESISPERYLQELKRKRDLLLLGEFSPSKFPWRSGLVALSVMLMFFPPSYVVLRWFAGDPLPGDLNWAGIVWRFAWALVMFALFLCIWKSNKLAADVFQKEIDALESARTNPMSA